jgi:hypothetical protein
MPDGPWSCMKYSPQDKKMRTGKMAVATWIDGLLRWPRLEVVWRGSCPSIMVCGLMRRNASITTFPFTLWIGSTTTATARWFKASKLWNHKQNTHQGVNRDSWIRHENMCAKNLLFVGIWLRQWGGLSFSACMQKRY